MRRRIQQLERTAHQRLQAQYSVLTNEFAGLLTPAQRKELLAVLTTVCPQIEAWPDARWQQVEASAPLQDLQHNVAVMRCWIECIKQSDFNAVMEGAQQSGFTLR